MGMKREARHRVHENGLAVCRTLARAALEVDRRFHMNEWERHEFAEAAGLGLQAAQAQQMPGPVMRRLDMAVHDGARRP